MRKAIIIASLVLSGLMILDSLNAGEAFTMLFLAGVLPGTNISISASLMLEVFALLIGFVSARVTNIAIFALVERFPTRLRQRA